MHTELNIRVTDIDQAYAVLIILTRRLQAAYRAVGESVSKEALDGWIAHQIEIIRDVPLEGLTPEDQSAIKDTAVTLVEFAAKQAG